MSPSLTAAVCCARVCAVRYKGQTDCILSCRWTLDTAGLFKQVTYVYTQMPDKAK